MRSIQFNPVVQDLRKQQPLEFGFLHCNLCNLSADPQAIIGAPCFVFTLARLLIDIIHHGFRRAPGTTLIAAVPKQNYSRNKCTYLDTLFTELINSYWTHSCCPFPEIFSCCVLCVCLVPSGSRVFISPNSLVAVWKIRWRLARVYLAVEISAVYPVCWSGLLAFHTTSPSGWKRSH